jgi:hypothetical protein
VDTDNDKAHVNISGFGQINDVPIFYHCPGSIVVEGGSVAFLEGDSVYVLNKEGRINPGASDLQIVGFVDGLKSCLMWEPWDGPDITTKHPWDTQIDPNGGSPAASLELWSDNGEQYLKSSLVGALSAYITIRWRDTYTPLSPKPQGLILKLQISATITGPSCTNLDAAITLIISDEHGEYVYLILAVCSGFVPSGPNQHYIGDNGGAEQTIDLADYGLADSICSVRIHLNAKAGWSGNYLCNYIHFIN